MISKYNFIKNVYKRNEYYNIELVIPYKYNDFDYRITGSNGFVQYGSYDVSKNMEIDTLFNIVVDKIQIIHITITLNNVSKKKSNNEFFDIIDMNQYIKNTDGNNIRMDVKKVVRKVVAEEDDDEVVSSSSSSSDDSSTTDSSFVEEVECDVEEEKEIDQNAINDESILTKVIRKVLREEMNNDSIKEVCIRMLDIIDEKSYIYEDDVKREYDKENEIINCNEIVDEIIEEIVEVSDDEENGVDEI